MNIEKFRLLCSINRMETSLFISVLHLKDWTKLVPYARWEIESRCDRLGGMIYNKALDDDATFEELFERISYLCSAYNLIVEELTKVGETYAKLKKNCDLEKQVLTVRLEMERSKATELGKLGARYGQANYRNERLCWSVEWGPIERAL